jgi:hypothetical protein
MRRTLVFPLAVFLLALAAVAPAPAADPPKPARGWADPIRYRDLFLDGAAALKKVEAVEMASAILSGSQMGPGEGWFHPGQTRYGWEWLARNYDFNNDGKITPAELQGPPGLFERLDRNHDGVLTADDFDWSDRSPYLQQLGQAGRVFRLIDADSNGKVSREEMEEFFKRLAKDRDYVTPEDLREAMFPPPPRTPGKQPQGPSPELLLKGLLDGEIGSVFPGPPVGQEAPDFTLKTEDGKREYRLSQWRGKKPVVLVFGSFT